MRISFIVIFELLLFVIIQQCDGYLSPYQPSPPGSSSYSYTTPSETYPTGFENEQMDEYFSFTSSRVVDSKGKYTLEWDVDLKAKTITFKLTVQTTGWVGVGLSKDGKMKGADIAVGWVDGNVLGYLKDLHADYNRNIVSDSQQNWKLEVASQNYNVTYLQVTRPLDTCDPYDYPVTTDLVWIIWAYGETDDLEYHFDKRGSFRAYLLDPIMKTNNQSLLQGFRLASQATVKEITTSYICSIHKGPRLLQKNHIVEFHPYLENQLAVNHVHHLLIWQCAAPPGMNISDIFEPLLTFPGEECYMEANHQIPINLCKDLIGTWAIGGNPYSLPYSVGIPIGESVDQYFMLEIHYNNPEALPLQITAGMDIYYTNQLRVNDGGNMLVAYDLLGLFMVPPVSPTFDIYAFCTQTCLQTIVPESGFQIVAASLHAHISGRKMTLQHFRNGKELGYILKDDNYDSTFQQYRVLPEPREILPGDLLLLKCTYDNTWTNITTVSGFATIEEMCVAPITITKRVPYSVCVSQVPVENLLSVIGAQDYMWDLDIQERVITAPPALAGKTLSYLTDILTDWTKSLRYKLQEVQLTTPSIGTCPQILLPTPSNTTIQPLTSRNCKAQ